MSNMSCGTSDFRDIKENKTVTVSNCGTTDSCNTAIVNQCRNSKIQVSGIDIASCTPNTFTTCNSYGTQYEKTIQTTKEWVGTTSTGHWATNAYMTCEYKCQAKDEIFTNTGKKFCVTLTEAA